MSQISNPQPGFAKDGEEMTVVVFDMCSSTAVLSDLQTQGKLATFAELIEQIDQRLWEARKNYKIGNVEIKGIEFLCYKFMGDGWVLLFSPEVDATNLVEFMHLLSLNFLTDIWYTVEEKLSARPRHVGLRFGVDIGLVKRFRMRGSDEYVGSPIVTATRLQSSGSQFESEEADPVLVSKAAFSQPFKTPRAFARYRPQLVSIPNPPAAVLLTLKRDRPNFG
jgi:hypothetical protein